jgi:hypothetical protein
MKVKTKLKIRKTHRYLGLFLGVQFLFWTLSGLYFSWTDLDEIHGDQYKNLSYKPVAFDSLMSPSLLEMDDEIHSIALRDIGNQPYYWINKKRLFNARTGKSKDSISRVEALAIAKKYLKAGLKIVSIDKVTKVDGHHEYRGRLLPAYVISYEEDALKAYVSVIDGKFQTVRHRQWRWFDFLWMTHTMDYEGRDDFNTVVLRVFSLLGLLTVLSGFLLWFVSSPTWRKLLKK